MVAQQAFRLNGLCSGRWIEGPWSERKTPALYKTLQLSIPRKMFHSLQVARRGCRRPSQGCRAPSRRCGRPPGSNPRAGRRRISVAYH
eukprot:6182617-Pleurochrysis_carterae.AAC.2